MQIQNGKLYENRTWRYLYPSLKSYGKDLMNNLAQFIKLGVGIADENLEVDQPCIFILIDTNMSFPTEAEMDAYKLRFAKFINWIRYQYFYVTDYVFEGLDDREKHMVVLRLPRKYDLAYISFIKGEYSKMYTQSEIYEYFKYVSIPRNKEAETKVNNKLKITRNILFKDKSYIPVFAKEVNSLFDTDNPESDFIGAELDFPPNFKQEVFNYTEK